jgi:hypothetical protein
VFNCVLAPKLQVRQFRLSSDSLNVKPTNETLRCCFFSYVSVVQISGHVGYVSSSPFREEGEWYMTKINVIAAVGDETRVQ